MIRLVSSAWAQFVAAGRATKAGGLHGVKAMTRRAADFHWPSRRWKSAVGTGVLIAVTFVMLGLGPFGPRVPQARAAGPLVQPSPPALLNVAELNDSTGLYFATQAEVPALNNLEQQAITNTLADHGLPSTEASAVQSWARDDAEAELYALLVQAANTAACSPTQTPGDHCRTTDQQNAVQWLADMAQREGVQEAYNAGLEYVKWAGLSQNNYKSDVTAYRTDLSAGNGTSTDKSNLEHLLNQGFSAPADYSCSDGTTSCLDTTSLSTIQKTATAGFCVYQSPAPYQSDYQGNALSGTDASMPAICDEPGGGIGCLIDCTPDTPAYNDFVKWGEADANYNLINSFDYTETAHDIALEIGVGGVAVAVATGVTLGATLGSVMAGSAFVATVFPSAGFVTGLSAATFTGLTLSGAGATGATSATAAAATAGAVGAAGIAAIAGAVLLFVVGTTAEVIQLVQDSQLPGQVATLIENSPIQSYDPGSMVNDSNGGAGELYSLFVNATEPSPLANCTQYVAASNPVCLDPPPPFAADLQQDREFSVSENGGTATVQPTISWYDKSSQVKATARVHETWFIEQAADNQGNPLQMVDSDGTTRSEVQTLRVVYTDWNGKDQTAELVNVPNVGYKFVVVQQQSGGSTLDPSTCLQNNNCAYSDTIDYVDSAGNKYSASLVAPVFPTVTAPTHSPLNPIEGQAVTLQTSVGPASGSFTVTWTILDKPLPTSLIICTDAQQHPIACPAPTVTVTGNPATYTFPTSGDFAVTVTASDSVGRSASSTTTINVADVAPAVNLLLDCKPIFSVGCQSYTEPLGSATILGGGVTHVGSEDVETLDVNWGDQTADTVSNVDCLGLLGCGLSSGYHLGFDITAASTTDHKIYLPFTGTHTYAHPGQYTVTLTVTDQSNAVSTTTFTETVQAPATTTTLTSSPNPAVWGQSVTLTATISSAYTVGKPSGTVEFKDGSGDIAGCAAQAVDTTTETATCVTSALSVAGHSISALYLGDSTFVGSTSATVSQPVNKAGTTTAVTSSGKPSMQGQPVTFTANVTAVAPGAGKPTGTVTFKDGATVLGTFILTTSGGTSTATFSTSGLGVGAHAITAAYNGDGNFLGSATSPLTQYVDTDIRHYLQANGTYNLSGVNLTGAYLGGANLSGANLANGNFKSATFTGANLSGANLASSNFKGANFTGANLSGANLSNSNFGNVIWSSTTCPDTTNSNNDGGSCLGHL